MLSSWALFAISIGYVALLFAIAYNGDRRARRAGASIADFVGARYGRHQPIAMLVTCIATIGVLPYVALQLKAVAFGFEVLSGAPASEASFFLDSAIFIAALLAAFRFCSGRARS